MTQQNKQGGKSKKLKVNQLTLPIDGGVRAVSTFPYRMPDFPSTRGVEKPARSVVSVKQYSFDLTTV